MRTRIAFGLLLILPLLANTLRADDKPADKPAIQKIDVDQFDQKRQEKDTVVLDVRTPKEYAEGHVPGAVNIDIHDPKFDEKIDGLDKSKTYLVHCAKGIGAAAARRRRWPGWDPESLRFPRRFYRLGERAQADREGYAGHWQPGKVIHAVMRRPAVQLQPEG